MRFEPVTSGNAESAASAAAPGTSAVAPAKDVRPSQPESHSVSPDGLKKFGLPGLKGKPTEALEWTDSSRHGIVVATEEALPRNGLALHAYAFTWSETRAPEPLWQMNDGIAECEDADNTTGLMAPGLVASPSTTWSPTRI